MNKKLLLKVFVLCLLFCQLVNKAQAQYAISGSAPNGLPAKVYWLTWNTANFQKVIDGGGPGISYPSGFIDQTGSGPTPGGSILPGNYIWQYSPTVRIKATIAPFTAATGGLLQPYTPGEFFTDGLDLMFSGNGISTKATSQAANGSDPTSTIYSRGVPYSAVANQIGPGQIQFNISINVEILIGGIWTDTPYPGMVIADAESMAAGELIQAITESSGVGAIGWQLIGFRKGDKPTGVTDANQNTDYKVTLSTAPGSSTPASQIALQVNGAGNYNTQGVFYAHGVKALKNVTVRGAGKTALAIGFIMPFDMGDAKNYTKVGAYINGFNTANNIVPADAVNKGVSTIAVTPLEPLANVYLGNNTVVDADGDNVLVSDNATDDDNATSPGIDDEDSVDPNAISPLKVNASGDVSAQVTKVTNGNASSTAKVYAWIDFDGNGKFNDYEAVDAVTPIAASTSTSAPVTLNFSRSIFGTHIKAGTTKMRVRVTTNSLTDNDASTVDGRSETYTGDGEVEDYQVTIPGITVSGNVYHDPTGSGTGTLISSVGSPAQALKAYLVKGSVIKQKVSVLVGAYTFTNVDNGTDYKILLSVKDVNINTATVSDITTGAMPAGWGSSGERFGLNNLLSSSQVTNVKDATADLQVLLSTPIAGQDVTVVNFSLTQTPVANPDAVSTNVGVAVPVSVLTTTPAGTVEDTDPDGSIDPATVLIMDPADNVYKTNVTTTKGVYSVAGTGIVTFTPATGFVGKATVNYKVKDNGGATSNVATITIDVKPTGQPDADVTTIGAPKTTNVINGTPTGTDSPGTTPPSAGATTITDIVKSANASTVVVSGNNITYTPVAGFVGKDTYTYRLTTSDNVKSDPITVTIDVKPTGQPDADVTTIGAPKTTNVINGTPTGTDSPGTTPPSAGATTITDIVKSANASTVVVSGNNITYTPVAGFVGKDTYTYRLTTSDNVKSDPITVTIDVKPTGQPDADVTTIGAPKTTNVINGTPTGTDSPGTTPPSAGATTITDIVKSANASTVVVSGNNITYTPVAGFVGKDTYTYRLTTSDNVKSDPITVTIDVKPTGQPDADVTTIGAPKTTNVINGTPTGTDSPGTTPPSAGATTITDIVKSANASTVVVSGNNITYTPVAGFVGKDTYTYRLTTSDNVKSDPITVTIDVKPTGQPDADVTTIGAPKTTNVINGTPTGTDSPGTTPPSAGATTITDIVKSANASTVVASGNNITYTPVAGFEGTDTYTYRLTTSDGVKSDPITVTITVVQTILAGVNDIDYVASYKVDLPFGINETPTQVATDVLTNDPDGSGATININDVSNGTNGTTTLNGNIITYTPNPNFIGTDTYTYKFTKPNGASNVITVTIHVSGITLKKEATNANAIHQAGDVINYNLTVKNVGPVALTNVVITDAGADAVTPASIASLAPNEEQIVTATHTVTPTDVTNGKYVNQATVTAKDPKSPTPNNVTAKSDDPATTAPNDPTEVLIIPLPASIALAKTGVLATSGNSINYTFTITNTGTVTLNTITLTDTKLGIDGVTIPAPAGGFLPAGTLTYNAAYTLTQADKDLGTVDNTATVTAKDPGNNTITGNGSTTTTVPASPSMSLSKVANNGATKAGDVINYTLIVKNTGNITLSNIVITDPGADAGSISPASIATLAPGASATITANHTVTTTNVTAGQYANQATATGKDPKNNTVTKISDDPGTTTPDDPTIVPITPAAPASINLAKTGTFSGNQVSYTFIITNNGGVALNTITLTDAKLGLNDVTITAPTGGLLPNQSLTYNATYTLTQADKDLGAVNNTATVSAKDPNNNTVTGTGSTVTTVPTSPVATNDAAETESGTPVIVSVLTNDDAKGSTFDLTSIEIVSNPLHGTVVTNANGTVTYTPTAGYTGTDSFTYRVKDAFGYYTNTATVTITTNLVVELKIPTLFSPNGDGVNDGFVIKDLGDYAQNELIVINRWGNEVYRQADYKNNWSGTGLNEGTYFYIVRLKKSNGESWVIKKGYVTLIRTFKK